jgi:hypothetical protein
MDLRVFGEERTKLICHEKSFASRVLLRHSSVFHSKSQPNPRAECRHTSHESSTSLELLGPTAYPDRMTLYSRFIVKQRLRNVALSLKSPALRVWLPSLRCQPIKSLGDCFNSQRSWASPCEALILFIGRMDFSIRAVPHALC